MNYEDPRLTAIIWSKIIPEPNSSCWLWIACLNSQGYASFWNNKRQTMVGGHRYLYEALVGPIPPKLDLDHKCRVTCCVNPDHLEPVTRSVNVSRGDTGKLRGSIGHRNTQKTRCPKGHPYIEDNLYKTKDGSRVCRSCRLVSSKNYRNKTRQKELDLLNKT